MFGFEVETIHRTAGIAGVAFYIAAYALLQAGILRGSGYLYTLLNLAAASLVLFSLSEAFNLASAIIQVFWIVLSIGGLARIYWTNTRIRFSAEEKRMTDDVFPSMPAALARRVLNGGIWADWPAGGRLTDEGLPVTHLHYVDSGRADVISGGKPIAAIRKGLIGEMNVMRGGEASATVVVAEPARVFSIPGDTLRRISAKDPELRADLEGHLSEATRRRLIEANARLAEWHPSQ